MEKIAGDRTNFKRTRHELLTFGEAKETVRSQVGRMDYVDAHLETCVAQRKEERESARLLLKTRGSLR